MSWPHVSLPSKAILEHVVDVHCHPTDGVVTDAAMDELPIHICAMASRADDQEKVADLARRWPEKVTPAFGWHPWHSHLISLQDPPPPKADHYKAVLLPTEPSDKDLSILDEILPKLPEPTSLASIIQTLRSNLLAHPNALVGEVGLDRTYRVPYVPYPQRDQDGKRLTPFKPPTEHQIAVFEAQFEVAMELKRSVSMHNVKAVQLSVDFFKRMRAQHGVNFGAINIDLHSCGISYEMWREIESLFPNIFLSLSMAINSRTNAYLDLILRVSDERILAESDYNNIAFVTQNTWDMVSKIAQMHNWPVESGDVWDDDRNRAGIVHQLEKNWKSFIGPGRGLSQPKEKSDPKRERILAMREMLLKAWSDEEDS